ncbi:MAG TPA: hypothetical protein DHU16_04140 [Gammaproteobacteria bacterium]|jgi:hypothetical protein|nr:hypothetical protein [Gammaproteobacteria bacterium]|tara:strand:- start:3 stop:350 length:348 start_codon:yes stop_codon:yes gene_type:complete
MQIVIICKQGQSLTDLSAADLADQIVEAKNSLVVLGRRIFRISSELSSLDENQRALVRQLSEDHELFENPQIIYAKMDEFYKASAGYVELLKDLNVRLVELSGQPYKTTKKDLPS